jgi:hypothetical protein
MRMVRATPESSPVVRGNLWPRDDHARRPSNSASHELGFIRQEESGAIRGDGATLEGRLNFVAGAFESAKGTQSIGTFPTSILDASPLRASTPGGDLGDNHLIVGDRDLQRHEHSRFQIAQPPQHLVERPGLIGRHQANLGVIGHGNVG